MNICKDLREALGLTVSALSKESKMSMNTLRLYEAGGGITSKSIAKLSAYFEVSADELEGKKALDIDAWIKSKNIQQAKPECAAATMPVIYRQEPELHQRGIVQVIKTSHSVATFYLEEGWILLDTAPMKDESGFYCLLGSTVKYNSEDFARVKGKIPKAKGYWMGS